ncbi:MAG: LCCL domain-containing protein [Sulfitobacter sp.]
MKHIFVSLALFLSVAIMTPAQAQSIQLFLQAEIDAAPACLKARDLEDGEVILCTCKASGFDRFIWGAGPYTGHSDICTAARHAGAIDTSGGTVVVTGRPGQKVFEAGDKNGIKGRRWGFFKNGFDVTVAAVGEIVETAPLLACQSFSVDAAPYECTCPAGSANRSVWGSGPYTGDSNVCTAARHAGVVGDDGGPVRITAEPGQASYEGSSANGVNTSSWGSYDQSFGVSPIKAQMATSAGGACSTMPADADVHTCSCEKAAGNTGSVWGNGPYTADSDICSAARHAGVIKGGGDVKVMLVPGLAAYSGSTANGVNTSDWNGFDASIIFDRN